MVESQRAFPSSWARWRLQNYSIYQVQRHFFPTIFCARGKRWWVGGCGERSINVLSSRLGPYQSCHHHYLSPTLVIPPLPFLSQYLIQLQKELSTIPSLQCAPYCTCLDIKDEGEATSHLFSRCSMLLQKGLAALLLNRVPNHPPPEVDGVPEQKLSSRTICSYLVMPIL